MSHMCVLVVGDVKKQLRPFQENNMGDCPKDLLKFNDETEYLKNKYKKDMASVVVMFEYDHATKANKRVILGSRYDEQFRGPYDTKNMRQTITIPEDSEIVEVPIKELHPNFDDYATDYCGYKKDPASGKYGYWENPNAQWDWYTVGGRFDGRIVTKKGKIVNQALVKDIDFVATRNRRLAEYEGWWNEAQALPENERGWRFDIKPGTTKEQYMSAVGKTGLTAWAVVKDEQWTEKDSMGWWGMASNEKDENVWRDSVDKVISELRPDDLLTVVDCHI